MAAGIRSLALQAPALAAGANAMPLSATNKGAVLSLLELFLQDGLYRVVVEDDGSLRILSLPPGQSDPAAIPPPAYARPGHQPTAG